MIQLRKRKLWACTGLLIAAAVLFALAAGAYRSSAEPAPGDTQPASETPAAETSPEETPAADEPAAPSGDPPAAEPAATGGAQELPDDSAFSLIAESGTLQLFADEQTGHFQVKDKRDGEVWHSYPDPGDWERETVSGAWREHLLSPLLVEYVDLGQPTANSTMTSVRHQKGHIGEWSRLEDGFRAVYILPGIGMEVAVEVRVADDYVEIALPRDGMVEGQLAALNMKAYPFFGAVHSAGQEGYMLLPDGAGALYRFKESALQEASLYKEPIYGPDAAFATVFTGRKPVAMPVFGMKAGDKGFVAVVTSGAEHGSIFGAPAGVYSRYNWLTVEHAFRLQYFQQTSSGSDAQGFTTYSRTPFQADRAVRYHMLEQGQSEYVDMASRYREYLLDETALRPVEAGSELPMYLDIVGGDVEPGFLWDRYIRGTSTDEARAIVERLSEAGLPRLTITYQGWQKNGASAMDFRRTTDRRLGGQEGMTDFIAFAQNLGHEVYLDVDYSLNSTGRSFRPRVQGAQSQAGRVLSWYVNRSNSQINLVSPGYSMERLQRDLDHYAGLGADGLLLGGIGNYLSSDFNPRYRASRGEAAELQRQMLEAVQARGMATGIMTGFAYGLENSQVIRLMPDDYSYDVFMDEPVPFTQIVLHGVIPYTSNWGNARDEQRLQFLRSVEYGAAPTFIVMEAETQKMKHAFSVWQYSLRYDDWESRILEEYAQYQEALGDVQDQFIVNHRKLADKVNETTYSGGKRIVVNYNANPVTIDGQQIAGYDFAVFAGGDEG